MKSFFKLVQIPPPRVLTISTSLSESALLEKIASQTAKRPRVFGKPTRFFGEIKNINFEVFYGNSAQIRTQSAFLCPVRIAGVSFDETRREFTVEIGLAKTQAALLRFSSGFLIFWWLLWTSATLLLYPALLVEGGTLFTSLILMPLGVIVVPYCWHHLRKVPENSLDAAQTFLINFLST